MYQAGNSIFNEFDKILVLAEGRVIYYGPRSLAQKYFKDLGFICPKGANISDFLTASTVMTERIVAPGMEKAVPGTPEEFEARFLESEIYRLGIESIISPETLAYEIEDLKTAVLAEKQKRHVPRSKSVYTVNLWGQIVTCTIR